jgi:hypothetical protein
MIGGGGGSNLPFPLETVHVIARHKLYSSVLKNFNGEIKALKSILD